MIGLEARGRAIGERAREQAAERVRTAIAAALPDARVEAGRDGVTIEGRGITRRWLGDARLRWISEWLK